MASPVPFTLEDTFQNPATGVVIYRIRVSDPETSDCPTVRYLTAPSPPEGASHTIPDHRGSNLAFDTVPAGDWNIGRLVVSSNDDATKGKFVLPSTEISALDTSLGLLSAGPVWHDARFDLIHLLDAFYAQRNRQLDDGSYIKSDQANVQCTGHVSALVLPSPFVRNSQGEQPQDKVVGIWAWQPGHAHGIANESHIYSLLQQRQGNDNEENNETPLAARFLGHITDNGTRVIGFLLEHIPGVRAADPEDIEACRDALGKLHKKGIALGGGLRRENFLVKPDGSVLLQGFGGAFETRKDEVFEEETEKFEREVLV
ncbi:hypothetical protein C8A03DRAFT_39175 [Achaetomium macrosporum]|uniref:Protein kinase domain-containing protein n=1 Tax=Achaetomium macrosporum TaxID=79813 RepID=A0AAN7C0U5_9PEZI|nr:hypothetical protein C8A03DRAFT_39175 [Achaetomium macrosporum]